MPSFWATAIVLPSRSGKVRTKQMRSWEKRNDETKKSNKVEALKMNNQDWFFAK